MSNDDPHPEPGELVLPRQGDRRLQTGLAFPLKREKRRDRGSVPAFRALYDERAVEAPRDPLYPTIFHEPWWLDAATEGDYHETKVIQGGQIVGRLPYVLQRTHGGGRLCTMPSLTHFLGPAINAGDLTAARKEYKEAQITRDLLRQLPATAASYLKMHAGITNMIPFQEFSYDVGVQFTFIIKPSSIDLMWKGLRDKTRNAIRVAQKTLMITDLVEPNAFFDFQTENLDARGLKNAHRDTLVRRLCAATLDRNRGRQIGTLNEKGQLTAAIFYVWDAQHAYYLMSTRSQFAGNGDVSVLIWRAMVDAAARDLAFDFDGISTAGNARFFAGFGGTVHPRYTASKYSQLNRTMAFIRNVMKKKELKFY